MRLCLKNMKRGPELRPLAPGFPSGYVSDKMIDWSMKSHSQFWYNSIQFSGNSSGEDRQRALCCYNNNLLPQLNYVFPTWWMRANLTVGEVRKAYCVRYSHGCKFTSINGTRVLKSWTCGRINLVSIPGQDVRDVLLQ